MAKSGQKWLKVAKSDQKWPEVTRSDQKWPKVTRSGQNSWKIQRIKAFDGKKSSRTALKWLWLLAGSWIRRFIRCWMQFFVFFRIFLFENGLEGHFESMDWRSAWKKNSEPFWIVSDRVGCTVLVGLKIDPWRRDGKVKFCSFYCVVCMNIVFVLCSAIRLALIDSPCEFDVDVFFRWDELLFIRGILAYKNGLSWLYAYGATVNNLTARYEKWFFVWFWNGPRRKFVFYFRPRTTYWLKGYL